MSGENKALKVYDVTYRGGSILPTQLTEADAAARGWREHVPAETADADARVHELDALRTEAAQLRAQLAALAAPAEDPPAEDPPAEDPPAEDPPAKPARATRPGHKALKD